MIVIGYEIEPNRIIFWFKGGKPYSYSNNKAGIKTLKKNEISYAIKGIIRNHFKQFIDSDDALVVSEVNNWASYNVKNTPNDL